MKRKSKQVSCHLHNKPEKKRRYFI